MNRLACVGKSSKVPLRDAEVGAPTVPPKPGDIPVNKGQKSQTSKFPGSRSEEKQNPPICDKRRNVRGSTRVAVNQGGMKDSLGIRRNSRSEETGYKHRVSQSEAGPLLHPPSPTDETSRAPDKPAQHNPPVYREGNHVSEKTEQINEPALQKSQAPKCPNLQSREEVEEEEQSSCGEDEDTDEFPAPLELLAEFLKAVMEKNYAVAQKLCLMILIYEPENAEARHFLPLIEERLQMEEAPEETCSGDNTSDENDGEDSDDDDDDSDADDDDDYDDSSDSDTDSADCCSSSSDAEEKNISQSQTASLQA